MILRRLQKGQSIIEFALVLPLFLLLLLGLIYVGMFMADYLALSSVARSSAREASIITDEKEINKHYPTVKNKYINYHLPIDIYEWNSNDNLNINYIKKDNNVVVTINAKLNKDGSYLANIVNGLSDSINSNFDLHITYTMYSEYKPSK